jgi:hypothetical protein
MLSISTHHTAIEFEVKGVELLLIHTSTTCGWTEPCGFVLYTAEILKVWRTCVSNENNVSAEMCHYNGRGVPDNRFKVCRLSTDSAEMFTASILLLLCANNQTEVSEGGRDTRCKIEIVI